MKVTPITLAVAVLILLVTHFVIANDKVAGTVSEVERSALKALVAADEATYPSARDRTINSITRQAPVDVLANESWEFGLAAFILNARRESPELFTKWEDNPKLAPSSEKQHVRKLIGAPQNKAAAAFFLEHIWKSPESSAQLADFHLARVLEEGWNSHVPDSVWISIWNGSSNKQMRGYAVAALSLITTPSPEVGAVLEGCIVNGTRGHLRNKYRVITGFQTNPSPYALRTLRKHWETLKSDPVALRKAATVFIKAGHPEDRQLLYELITSKDVAYSGRVLVIGVCAQASQKSDIEPIAEFLKDLRTNAQKANMQTVYGYEGSVMTFLKNYEYVDAAPLLLETLKGPYVIKDDGRLRFTLATLRSIYRREFNNVSPLGMDAIARDRAVLEDVRERVKADRRLKELVESVEEHLQQLEGYE